MQHVLKLWEALTIAFPHCSEQPYEISRLDSCKHFYILMRRISFDCQTSSESLWQPEAHYRVEFIHTTIVPWQWSEAVKFTYFFFLNFASLEALILSPIRNSSIFPHRKLARSQLVFSPPEQANHFLVYVRIHHLQSWSCSLVLMLNFLLFGACFSFSFCLCISVAKLGLASRWRSTARFRATSLFHKELAKSDQ